MLLAENQKGHLNSFKLHSERLAGASGFPPIASSNAVSCFLVNFNALHHCVCPVDSLVYHRVAKVVFKKLDKGLVEFGFC
jgi:hypothetical protein